MRRLIVLALVMASCGGDGAPKKTDEGKAWTVEKGASLSFAAVVAQALECPVASLTWTATGGTITPDGLYTAPGCDGGAPGRFRVTAEGCGKSAYADVDVTDTTITSVRVCIPFPAMATGATQQMYAEKTYQCPGHVEWSPSVPPPGYCP